MGAGASALPPTTDRIDKATVENFAGDKFDKEAFEKAASEGTVSCEELRTAWRKELLDGLFRACDDDNSGALSFSEFTQMLQSLDDATKNTFGSILFGQADADKDGKLNIDEFVASNLKQLASLSDDDFKSAVEKLQAVAKERVAIDKEAAVVDKYDSNTKSTVTAVAAPAGGTSAAATRFVSYTSFPPNSPRFVSYSPFATAGADKTSQSDKPERRALLQELFNACDKDGSGALSYTEYLAILGKMDESTKQRFGSVLFGQADADNDGKLSVDEFVTGQQKSYADLDDDSFKLLCQEVTAAAKGE